MVHKCIFVKVVGGGGGDVLLGIVEQFVCACIVFPVIANGLCVWEHCTLEGNS